MERKILFKAENISKAYPGTQALKNVSMEVYEGQVVGLIGENGAGKSTLLKIIMGVEAQSSGDMWIRDKKYEPKNPKQANEMGVGMVFQEQSLIANLTVGQNIFFGKEMNYKKLGFIDWKRMYKDAKKVLEVINMQNVKPEVKVSELNFAARQMVEIAKVLNSVRNTSEGKSVILLDEPTSVLNDEEIKQLFKQVEELKKEGNAIIFVSHRLDEVIEISDKIYVFKDGKNVGLVDKQDADESILYEKMVGRTSTGEYYKVHRQVQPSEKVILDIRNMGLRGAFKDVSFKLHEGEVLGICGVVGSGKEDLCAVISGDEKATSGEFYIEGKKAVFSNPSKALDSGILSIPKERREEGIIGILNIYENISLSNLDNMKKLGFVSKKKQIEQSQKWIEKLNIKCSCNKELMCQLSGGNAQKVVFARVLASSSKVLILNHPTRGVDIGAKEEIYSLIRDITTSGFSVILLGDTLDECIGLSNRILVMKDGLLTKEFEAPAECKPEQVDIIKYMM
jgi:ribose transport system ATP-binding protein